MIERNKAVPASHLILEHEGKVLLARRCNTGYQDGNYQFPAGHVDAGELPMDAMVREAQEEIGITIDRENLTLVHMIYRTRRDVTGDRVDLFFAASVWAGEVTNMEPNKCDDLLWVEPDVLPENTLPVCRIALDGRRDNKIFTEMSAEQLAACGL
jgi:mutator protein MutT